MKGIKPMMRCMSSCRLLLLVGLVTLGFGAQPGCQPAAPSAAAPAKAAGPSKVSGAVKEADLAKLELTEKAEERLGVVVVEAKRQPVPRAISYGGEVMIPPGRLISVSSPFLGTVEAPPAPPSRRRAPRSSKGSRSSSSGRSSRPRPAPPSSRSRRRPTARSSRRRSSSRSPRSPSNDPRRR